MSVSHPAKKVNDFSAILPPKFTNKPISGNVSHSYLEDFKQCIDFTGLLHKHLDPLEHLKAPNSKFSVNGTVEFMIDAGILGFSRFLHMNDLRNDRAYQMIHGEAPSEKVCRDLLKRLPADAAIALRELNRSLLAKQALLHGVKEVCLDFDDTVVTVFGEQEKAKVGYNPRYHGRASYKEKVGMISGSKELVDLTLEEGNHHSNHKFLDFLKQCEDSLPKQMLLKRVRADCGFFDQATFTYLEDQYCEYVIKAKRLVNVQKIVNYVVEHPKEYLWVPVVSNNGERTIFHATEITVPLPKWVRARRFVIVRKTLPEKLENGQLIFDEVRFEYQVIVTNIDYMSSDEIFHEYNQRCTLETSIDELKDGFAFSENSQMNHKCNELFLLIKMIAYNLQNWFQQVILPEDMRHHRIQTLRRKFYRVSGILSGNGWYRHILYQANAEIKRIATHVYKALGIFRKRCFSG